MCGGECQHVPSGQLPLRLVFMQNQLLISTNVFIIVPTRKLCFNGVYEQTICTRPFLTAVQLIFYVLKKIYAFVLKCKSVYTVLLCVMLWENLFVVVDMFFFSLHLWMCREQSVVGLRRTASALSGLSEDWCRMCELCRHRSNMPSDPYMNKYTRPFLKCRVSPLF